MRPVGGAAAGSVAAVLLAVSTARGQGFVSPLAQDTDSDGVCDHMEMLAATATNNPADPAPEDIVVIPLAVGDTSHVPNEYIFLCIEGERYLFSPARSGLIATNAGFVRGHEYVVTLIWDGDGDGDYAAYVDGWGPRQYLDDTNPPPARARCA
jgi:hypothetical protein